jgi:hypothetical protein
MANGTMFFLKSLKSLIPDGTFMLLQWFLLVYKDSILQVGKDEYTVENLIAGLNEFYDVSSGELNLSAIIQSSLDEAIDRLSIEVAGYTFDDLPIVALPDILDFSLHVPALGEFLEWINMGQNPTAMAWAGVLIGPNLLVDLDHWAEDAVSYALSPGVLTSELVDDVVSIFSIWGGMAITTIRVAQSLADALVEYNDFAQHYNQLRFELMLNLAHRRDEITSTLSNLIDLSQLAGYLTEQFDKYGMQFDLNQLPEIADSILASVNDGVDYTIASVIEALDQLPILPEIRSDLMDAIDDINLLFDWSDPLADITGLRELYDILWDIWNIAHDGEGLFESGYDISQLENQIPADQPDPIETTPVERPPPEEGDVPPGQRPFGPVI